MKLILIIFMLFSSVAHASFVTNFVNDVSNHVGPAYYQSQERGYVTFGSYSKRTPNVVINPISITPPSISVGCNGIDLVTGGFSFLTEQGLRNMYRQLTNPNNAVYIATSIAMKLLSNELAGTIESAMDMIHKLNSMQLDSCAIANNVVTLATDGAARDEAKNMARAVKSYAGGMFNSPSKASQEAQRDDVRQSHINSELANYSAKEYMEVGGSMIEYIYTRWRQSAGASSDPFAFPAKYDIGRLRALYGDVIHEPNNKETFRTIPPCGKTLDELETQFFTRGTAANGECRVVTGEQSITQYVQVEMTKLYHAISGTSDTPINQQFVTALQGSSVLAIIRADAGVKDTAYLATTVDYLRKLARTELAYMYTDIYFQHLVPQIQAFRADAAANAGVYAQNLIHSADTIINNATGQHIQFRNDYEKVLGESLRFMQVKRDMEQLRHRGGNDLARTMRGR